MQVALSLTAFAPEPQPSCQSARGLSDVGLSPLQREVVAIGRADAEGGAVVPGSRRLAERIRGAAALIIGHRRARPLADPRLEALRRFAQRAALGREQISDVRAMQSAGYAASQIVMAARLARRENGE